MSIKAGSMKRRQVVNWGRSVDRQTKNSCHFLESQSDADV